MQNNSYNTDLKYNEDRVRIQLILETSFSKEMRILLKKGQVMKEHRAPYPIVVHLLEGVLDFGIEGKVNRLHKGDILTLEGKVPHDLLALEDSIVRLTISSLDKAERVEEVAKESTK